MITTSSHLAWTKWTTVFLLGVNLVAAAESEAVKKLRACAEHGDQAAMIELGCLLYGGKEYLQKGVVAPIDKVEALKWKRKAAEDNYHWQLHLGFIYADEKSGVYDLVEAYAWLKPVTWAICQEESEQKFATDEIARILKKMTPDQVLRAEARAKEVAKIVGPSTIKSFRDRGMKVGPPHSDTSFHPFYMLCLIYALGEAVPRDAAEAYFWLCAAELDGYVPPAVVEPASLHKVMAHKQRRILERELTEEQMKQVERRVVGLYELMWLPHHRWAALGGDAEARLKLASMYAEGKGVSANLGEAYAWCNLGSTAGDNEAKQFLAFIAAQMTPDQVSQGKKRSQALILEITDRNIPPLDWEFFNSPTGVILKFTLKPGKKFRYDEETGDNELNHTSLIDISTQLEKYGYGFSNKIKNCELSAGGCWLHFEYDHKIDPDTTQWKPGQTYKITFPGYFQPLVVVVPSDTTRLRVAPSNLLR